MSWSPLTAPINYVSINGQKTPGTATVKGASDIRKWDELVGPGLSGAFSIFRGKRLAHFSVVISLLKPEDWGDWYGGFKAMVEKLKVGGMGQGQRATAFSIWHPWLVDVGVKAAVVEEILQPVEAEPGRWEIEIKMLEHRRPIPAKAFRPDGTTTTTNDPYDMKIEQLTERLARQQQELAK